MQAFRIVPWLLLLALTSCGRENTRVIKERRNAVSTKLDRIQTLRAALPAIPPVVDGKISLGAAPLVMGLLADSQLPTGTVVYEQALENLRGEVATAPHYSQRIQQAKLLEECGALLERGGIAPSFDPVNMQASIAKQLLDSCANLEYVFVLRTRVLSRHEFIGDIVAFELASGRYLGGFPLSFASEERTDTVTSTSRPEPKRHVGRRPRYRFTTKSVTNLVNADADQLLSDLAGEVESGIKQFVPAVRWLKQP